MSSTTTTESNVTKEATSSPIANPSVENKPVEIAPPPLATLCSESIITNEVPTPVAPFPDDKKEVVPLLATQGNEKKVESKQKQEPKQDETVKQPENPQIEIKQNAESETTVQNIEEQKASELGNTSGENKVPSTTELVATKDNALIQNNQNTQDLLKDGETDAAAVNAESDKIKPPPTPLENANKNDEIKETKTEPTQDNITTNGTGDTETKSEDLQEEDCVNIQELTAHVMEILNEGIAEENSNREELMKKNLDLQQFIVKLIHLLKEKTDLCSNLDRQNTALTCQAKSLKDVIAITKDLLGIRNLEVERLHSDLNSMEEQIKAERNRHNTAVQHLNEAMGLNSKLKAEYLTQMDLFQKLKDKYTEKVVLLTKENIRLKSVLEESGISVTPQVNGNIPSNTEATQSESVDK